MNGFDTKVAKLICLIIVAANPASERTLTPKSAILGIIDMKHRRAVSKPRIRIHKDGKATFSGLNYQDLRSLLTCAMLENYRSLERFKKEGPRHPDDKEYLDNQNVLFKWIQSQMDQAIQGTYPEPEPLNKKERFESVRRERAERKLIDDLVDSMTSRLRASRGSHE